jgi:glycosyltransferase involved in cell wall biosynthesis
MRIAFLTPEYPHEKVAFAAGIGTSVKNLTIALVKAQVSVSLFIYGQQTDEVFVEGGITFHLIKAKKFSFFTWYHYRKYLQNYINQRISTDSIDLVEAVDWCGITAFMNLDKPLVIRFHGSDAYFCHLEKRKQKLKNFFFEKLAIQKATAYIAPTDFAGLLTKKIFGIQNKTIQTIHYGLSLSQFNNSGPSVYEKGLILYIGTIIRKKGVLELPAIYEKVLVKCPEAKLIIIGSDSYDLKTKSKSTWLLLQNALNGTLYSKVKYLGKVPYQQVQDYIRSANVCVFPTFAETLGMVTIESMAMQKPVVNSNIGWSEELINDGESGFLVHPTAHDLYAERIVSLIQNDDLCQSIGIEARKKVAKDFDIEKVVQQNIDFYRSVLSKKNS